MFQFVYWLKDVYNLMYSTCVSVLMTSALAILQKMKFIAETTGDYK